MTDDEPTAKPDKAVDPNEIVGTWISMGAGLGMVIGMVWFDQFMWGIVMGAGVGAAFGAAFAEQAKVKAREGHKDS